MSPEVRVKTATHCSRKKQNAKDEADQICQHDGSPTLLSRSTRKSEKRHSDGAFEKHETNIRILTPLGPSALQKERRASHAVFPHNMQASR